MPFNSINTLSGLFGFLKKYGALLDEIIEAIKGYSTSTSGIINPIYQSPKKVKPFKARKRYVDKPFDFHIKEPLTIQIRRKYSFIHEIPIVTGIETKVSDSCEVLTPLTVNVINSLTVYTKTIPRFLSENFSIFTEMIYNRLDRLSVSTILKSTVLNLLSIKVKLTSGRKSRFNISTPLEDTKLVERLENQSVYMDDVGIIDDMELIQIIGDIDAIRG